MSVCKIVLISSNKLKKKEMHRSGIARARFQECLLGTYLQNVSSKMCQIRRNG